MIRYLRNALLLCKLRNYRLRTRLMGYFSLIILIPLIGIGCFTFLFVEKVIEENTVRNVSQTLVQANNTIEYYLHDLVNVAAVLNVNDQLINMLEKENEASDQYERIKNEYAISGILTNTINTKREIFSIALFTEKNIYFSGSATLEPLRKSEWFQTVNEGRADKIFIADHNIIAGTYPKRVYSLAYGMKEIKSSQWLGTILVNLDDKVIRKVLDKIDFGAKSSVFMLDQNKKVVYERESNPLKIFDAKALGMIDAGSDHAIYTINREKYFIVMHTSEYSQWSIVWFIPFKTLMAKAEEIRNVIFLIAFICTVIALLLAFTLSSNVTIPMKRLIMEMERVKQGNLDVKVSYRNFYELGELSDNFNSMISEVKDLIERVYKEQNAKRKAEIRVLESQINPHFLYNTLDSIKWVAILQKADHVGSMITNLVKLLRISLSGGSEFISVEQEIEHVRNYLEIQRFRYNDRFDAVFDIPAEIMQYRTLKIILQPLVENALFYGIEPKKAKGTITVSGGIEENSLFLTVEDDGIGLECSSTEELYKVRGDTKNRMYKGIGIRNIDERIKLYFGEGFGVDFSSRKGKGTQVKIRMPLMPAGEE